ncbi:transcription factor MYB27 isoform X2 [Ziziphus jujuba]|uniref:Transcription factor MYB27 isoform X2 n=2 Tax=Ziziphus jujuba TaxID=326968 RepID=A0A6P6GPM8_ZIZJJ|nr:transcription factor MYB27 isoform X2 [Ziziphus jujuba]KAH7512018.1 hypothetical protein FEM48_Zijuj12G0046000 [Ziziphus jujuba var. spinosa]
MQFQVEELRRGTWLDEEDERLTTFVNLMGERRWDDLAKASGLRRSGKSCRLRWLNYLRPNLKHGNISVEEENIIHQLHERWGNKWSKIARRLPGRTDNEIKNYWRSHLRKKTQIQQDNTHNQLEDAKEDLLLFQNADHTSAQRSYNYENYHGWSVEDSGGTECNSIDAFEFSLASSPYATRMSDWISDLSNDQSQINYQDECNSIDSSFCFLDWTPDDGLIWDCSAGSLWDMN